MSTKTETKQVLDFIDEKATTLMEALTAIIDQYGSDAWALAELAIRLDEASNMLMAAIGLGLSAAFINWTWRKRERDRSDDFMWFFPGTVLSVVPAIISIIAGVQLFSLWNWAVIVEPKLFFVRHAISKFL